MNLFVGYVYWQYQLPLGGFSFHSLKGIFWWTEVSKFNVVHFISYKTRNLFLPEDHKDILLCDLQKAYLSYILHVDLQQQTWN